MIWNRVQWLRPAKEIFKRGSNTMMFTQQISQHLLLRHLLADIRETQAPLTGAVSAGFPVSRIASRSTAKAAVSIRTYCCAAALALNTGRRRFCVLS
jgi:hypothetical protein